MAQFAKVSLLLSTMRITKNKPHTRHKYVDLVEECPQLRNTHKYTSTYTLFDIEIDIDIDRHRNRHRDRDREREREEVRVGQKGR